MLIEKTEAEKQLATFPGWEVSEGEIEKKFLFPSFLEAITFVNKVSTEAEKAQHHPDIDIRYSKVKISLATHEEGGVTEKDIKLARIIDNLT
ncbi:MAG: 4a-hydroxytetrahydrobiopterin dehydratase [bacterium]|nr:4a-hydroxytetrahydrobiopterin dehydratase [bacterium]